MPQYSPMDMPVYSEDEVSGELPEIYEDIKRVLQYPFVPNFYTALSSSPNGLQMLWSMNKAYQQNLTLPYSLTAMINYFIATKSYCEYCSSAYEMNCRTIGIDEDVLKEVIKDLDSVNPRRLKLILEFALKTAKYPKELSLEDFNGLREEGVTDAEILEIVMIAGFTVITDIVADALKIEVDPPIFEAIGRDYVFEPNE